MSMAVEVFPYECAPFNLRTEAGLALQFAKNHGWLDRDATSEVSSLEYRISERSVKCGFGNEFFEIWAEHDLISDEWKTTIAFKTDLDTNLSGGLRFRMQLDLSPVYLGPQTREQFGAEIAYCRLTFTGAEKSLEVVWAGNDLVIYENKGKGEKPKIEKLYAGGKWEGESGKKSFAEMFNSDVVRAPRWIWLTLVNRALAGELTGKGPQFSVAQMVERTLLGRLAVIALIFGV